MENGLYGIAVISGDGVMKYYEDNGYYKKKEFMIKDFPFFKVWFYRLKSSLCFYILMPCLIVVVFILMVVMLYI